MSKQRQQPRAALPSHRLVTFVSIALALGMTFGCAGAEPLSVEAEPDVENTAAFLAVARSDVDANEAARMRKMMAPAATGLVDPGETFYLAIHKRELERRWFLSAYLKQFSPGGPQLLGAQSLGIRVVSFRVQNGKLFVFDVDDRKRLSDNFVEQPVIEAYPIIDTARLSAAEARKYRDYVVVDPAAGLNRFGVVGDTLGSFGIPFKVELAFSQNFRALADGAGFEQAFTGYIDEPLPFDGVDPNPLRITGILSLALRHYEEPAGFVPTPAPAIDHYFTTLPHRVPNTGNTSALAIKWNIHPGMKPITWRISPLALKAQARPEVAAHGIDLVGAIKAGVESWNVAFGFSALRAELADDATSFGNDEGNHLIYDVNPPVGMAYADFRPNPNNGEIRGANVYMNDYFLVSALAEFAPPRPGAGPVAAPKSRSARLIWQAMKAEPLCDFQINPLAEARRAAGLSAGTPGTPKERVEKAITFIIAHEIGHTLGLRHNFKGSLLPPSSSVMDYVVDSVSIGGEIPAAYDIEAIQYLYGLSPTAPRLPFCTDDQVAGDPTCARWDHGADPLREHWGPMYQLLSRDYLRTGDSFARLLTTLLALPNLTQFIQFAPRLADRSTAWDFAVGDVGVPADAARIQAPASIFPITANSLLSAVVAGLVPDPATLVAPFPGGPIPTVPALDAATSRKLLDLLRGVVLNSDGIRPFSARRNAVDTLKWMQTLGAYGVLRDTQVALSTRDDAAPPTAAEQALLDDLQARIAHAVTPYFNK